MRTSRYRRTSPSVSEAIQGILFEGDGPMAARPGGGLTVSAKELGAFAMSYACERCLWIHLHVPKLPYQMFPGIFSSIDGYNKKIVHGYFDSQGRMPAWLDAFGDVVGYVPPPPHQRFSVTDEKTGVTLRGSADGIFRLRDGSHAIVDYKTAKYTAGQARMLTIYRTQLNGYAYIAERVGLSPVSRLALIYMDPLTDLAANAATAVVSEEGFRLGFSATIVPVGLQPETSIPPLLKRVRALYDLAQAPAARSGCRDCNSLHGLIAALQ